MNSEDALIVFGLGHNLKRGVKNKVIILVKIQTLET